MALSDISRKEARSDVQSRVGIKPNDEIIDEEINRWLNMEQFNFFNRMGILVNKWYGKSETVSVTATAGAVTAISLASNYAATKIAQITKFILEDASTVWKPKEFDRLEHMLGETTYDNEYAYAIYGEKLYVFVGVSATALTTDSSVLYFIRKPDEMAGDTNVFTVTFASATTDDYIDVDGIRFVIKAAVAEDYAYFVAASNDAGAANLEDIIDNVFQTVTGVSSSSSSAVVTITGAKTVTSNNSTRLAVATSTASMVDVPTEYVDLIIMGAQAKAMGKLKMTQERNAIEQDLARRYAEIAQSYGQEIQLAQIEKAAGIQSPQRKE
ncbi:MAG: hypothetical protein E3J60_04635 [Dehalococcoidia bacterium]|nr:MAG: hypothetical protein E3J60_04635 [Dehalococcoidia bacterium]